MDAVTSGLLVPSSYWRAEEVIAAVDTGGLREAAQLRDAYRAHCPPVAALPRGPS
jgi:hypothetical protein